MTSMLFSRKRSASLCRAALIGATAMVTLAAAQGVQAVTTPKAQFGHNIGDDYFLANYTQMTAYFAKLAKESDRLKIEDIGRTVEGREMQLLVVSAPENLSKLDRYMAISARLAHGEGLTDAQAQALAD